MSCLRQLTSPDSKETRRYMFANPSYIWQDPGLDPARPRPSGPALDPARPQSSVPQLSVPQLSDVLDTARPSAAQKRKEDIVNAHNWYCDALEDNKRQKLVSEIAGRKLAAISTLVAGSISKFEIATAESEKLSNIAIKESERHSLNAVIVNSLVVKVTEDIVNLTNAWMKVVHDSSNKVPFVFDAMSAATNCVSSIIDISFNFNAFNVARIELLKCEDAAKKAIEDEEYAKSVFYKNEALLRDANIAATDAKKLEMVTNNTVATAQAAHVEAVRASLNFCK